MVQRCYIIEIKVWIKKSKYICLFERLLGVNYKGLLHLLKLKIFLNFASSVQSNKLVNIF